MQIGKYNVTVDNVRSFITGKGKKMLDDLNIKNMPDHQVEQLLVRAILCKDCLESGKCVVCKCDTPDLFYDPKRKDSKGKWGPMMDKEKWEAWKERQNSIMINNYSKFYHSLKIEEKVTTQSITGGTYSHNFGEVKKGNPPVYEFKIKNTTDKPLVADNVAAACGCTASRVTKDYAEPGDYIKVKIKYDAKKLGSFEKVSVVNFDGNHKPVTLIITGKVV